MYRRPKVLVIAEAANPDWVSVPLVGWNIASSLRAQADIHLITQIRNRDAILAQGWTEGVDFTAIDSEKFAAPMYKLANRVRGGDGKGWTTITAIQSLVYPYFEHLVWKQFGAAIKSGDYDIVHRVTPLSPTSPSSLARKCKRYGVPFVLGPLNGGLPWPAQFQAERIKEKEWLSFVRRLYALLPGSRATYRNASAIIAASRHTYAELAPHNSAMVYIPENGIDPDRFSPMVKEPASPLRLCFVGRLVPYKGADIALAGAAEILKAGQAHFDIIGDGPEMGSLVALADRLGISGQVTFHGWKAVGDVAALVREAHLLVFPSVREFGGGVVLEAMASGVVPMIVDYGGPAELIDKTSGIAIPLADRAALISAYEDAFRDVLKGKFDLAAMSKTAVRRSQELYSWKTKAGQIREVYDWVLSGHRLPPPDFGLRG